MTQELPMDLTEEDISGFRSWKRWILAALITLLVHLLLLAPSIHWNPLSAPPRVEIQQVDPKKLQAIRDQWRKQSLLLDTDKNHPKDQEAPKNAKYFSDRNIRVEKEERARDTAILPKPGGKPIEQHEPSQKAEKTSQFKDLPKLGDLGIPFKLSAARQPEPPPQPEGGSQYIDDQQVPVGGQTMLNAQESVYYSFYARIYETIGPLWESKIQEVSGSRKYVQGDYVTQVDVVFDSNGFLKDVHVLHGSGIPEFDNAVHAAWVKANRFPNPPHDLLDANGEVHTGWSFIVKVGPGFGAEYLPPRRNY